MGTDVHAIFQKLDTNVTPPKWVEIDSEWEQGRHYLLFGALANVRNGYGFGGVVTGDAIPPICKPRGLPKDVLNTFTLDDCDLGDHTFSWLTVEEMLEWYDGGINLVKKRDIVSKEYYDQWDKKSKPSERGRCVFGQREIVVDAAGYESLKTVLTTLGGSVVDTHTDVFIRDQLSVDMNKALTEEFLQKTGMTLAFAVSQLFNSVTSVIVEWDLDFKVEMKYFFDEMRRLKDTYGTVRMVFGFDN